MAIPEAAAQTPEAAIKAQPEARPEAAARVLAGAVGSPVAVVAVMAE